MIEQDNFFYEIVKLSDLEIKLIGPISDIAFLERSEDQGMPRLWSTDETPVEWTYAKIGKKGVVAVFKKDEILVTNRKL